jgi:hypothetical protein
MDKSACSEKIRNPNPFLVSEESAKGIPRIPGFILASVKADGCRRNFVGLLRFLSLHDAHDEIIDVLAKPADEAILCPLGRPIDLDMPESAEMLSETEERLFRESAIQHYTESIRNQIEFIGNTAATIQSTLNFQLPIWSSATMRSSSVDHERFSRFCVVGEVGYFHLDL